MEINDKGPIDFEKLRQQANSKNPSSSQFNSASKYANSPNKDRSLENVLIPNLNVCAHHKLQHAKDTDMTYPYLPNIENGYLMYPHLVSNFDLNKKKNAFTENMMQLEYSYLERLYQLKEVDEEKLINQIYETRNRYVDINVYNKTRVKLTNGVDKKKKPEGDYINACYINSPFILDGDIKGDCKIIASQGPLPETVHHFWQMIVENNVTMIISTCRLKEQGRTKCDQFWPSGSQAKFCVTQDDANKEFVLVNLLEEVEESSFCDRREMQVQRLDGTTQNVTQIHFKGWPDHGTPSGQTQLDFELMLDRFVEWNLKSAPKEKAIVHCSAGIGRTGTTISLME